MFTGGVLILADNGEMNGDSIRPECSIFDIHTLKF